MTSWLSPLVRAQIPTESLAWSTAISSRLFPMLKPFDDESLVGSYVLQHPVTFPADRKACFSELPSEDNLELASLPTTTEEMRKRLLSFVVCGGGPTGVEFAAELCDMMGEDGMTYVSKASLLVSHSSRKLTTLGPCYPQYPKLLRQQMSIHIIQSRDHILCVQSPITTTLFLVPSD